MAKIKIKKILKEINWLIFVVALVTVTSFALREINNFIQNKIEISSVQAITANVLKKNTNPSYLSKNKITQVSTFLKIGYVGNYLSVNLPGQEQEKEFTKEELKDKPKVLGLKTTRMPYQAELVKKSYSVINVDPGERITFEAEFRNTGTKTWSNSGKHFVALNVTNPPGRKSAFRDIFWPKYYRPAVMTTKTVKPGKTGLFRFALTAPFKKDEYVEKFGLVVENITWIDGGDLDIAMRVGNPKTHFSAEKVGQAYDQINLKPGKAITFWVDFKNTGSQTWYRNSDSFIALNVTDPTGRKSGFQHGYWLLPYRPAKMKNKIIRPNEIARFEFALKAPLAVGDYVENFGLVAENLTWIKGGGLSIPIKVEAESKPIQEIEGEPDIRVGLYPTTSEVKITADGTYKIRDTENKLIGSYDKEIISTVTYANGVYHLTANGITTSSVSPLRFIPKNKQKILEIINYHNQSTWNASLNDNRYRGVLEIHYAEESERLWVINELPLESYLRGVAEAGNDNDEDYLKSLMIAARTYALYHIQTNAKHDEENFTVDAVFDQVYRGYGFELRAPKITQAILDTQGLVVTYNNEIAITPYFSQSDGRTRSWEEVWAGGPYPWLVSVPDPACEGKELLGHGVGMSAYGAMTMANEGKISEEILKHYYTGVEISKIY